MPTRFAPVALLACALIVAACSSEQVAQVSSRPGVNLSQYHTYGFLDEAARNDSAFMGAGSNVFDLKRAVAQQLEARGLRRAAQPDLWVNLGLMTRLAAQARPTSSRSDAPAYLGQRTYRRDSQEEPGGGYQEGTVTIDLVDAARNQQVWQGTTTSILSRSRSDRQIERGVADVFARFPVPAQ